MAGIVVWEWQNEFGCWRPYDPSISGFIETNKSSLNPLKLGSVDPTLYLYEIDLQNMCQVRQGTGTQRTIRRTVHPPTSPLAKGITWQWEGDVLGQWNDFDVNIIECLEDSFSKGHSFIDLTLSKVGLPYHIDLTNMTQTRIHTGRVRKIQRVFTSSSYPIDLSVSSQTGKRGLLTGNMNSGVKKPKTVSSSVITPTSSSSTSSFMTAGLTFPSSSTNGSYGFPNSLLYPPVCGSGSTSTTSSVIQFGQSQGPLTRRRYNHTLAAMGIQGHPQGHMQGHTQGHHSLQGHTNVIQPTQALPSTTSNNNNNMNNMPNLNVHGTGSSYTNSSFPAGFMHGLFPSHTAIPSYGGFGGLPHQHMPSAHYGLNSSSSASAVPQPLNFPHTGSLNTNALFGGSSSRSGRVRPTSTKSSRKLPQSGRISNVDKSSLSRNVPSSSDIIDTYAVLLNSLPADEDCCICCEKLQEASGHGTGASEDHAVIQLEKCSHMFHKLCFKAMYESGPKEGSVQCPNCKTIYGEKRGNCPTGEMEYRVINHDLPGYEGHKTIQITYLISSGTQGPEHPHPGKRYSTRGFPRVGYIPDCDRGRKMLQLLIVAWKRRLTFTVGTSSTTGEDDTVVWNEIHHKTELGTNYSGHGYPDPKYLDNLSLELAVHGITEKDLPT